MKASFQYEDAIFELGIEEPYIKVTIGDFDMLFDRLDGIEQIYKRAKINKAKWDWQFKIFAPSKTDEYQVFHSHGFDRTGKVDTSKQYLNQPGFLFLRGFLHKIPDDKKPEALWDYGVVYVTSPWYKDDDHNDYNNRWSHFMDYTDTIRDVLVDPKTQVLLPQEFKSFGKEPWTIYPTYGVTFKDNPRLKANEKAGK